MPVLSKYAVVIKLFFISLVVLLGNAAFAEPVKVEGGLLQGTVEDGLRVYRGIPYAAPPVDDLRWRSPQPAPKWQGVRPADQFGRARYSPRVLLGKLHISRSIVHAEIQERDSGTGRQADCPGSCLAEG
jgi:Carboxylesterase family